MWHMFAGKKHLEVRERIHTEENRIHLRFTYIVVV